MNFGELFELMKERGFYAPGGLNGIIRGSAILGPRGIWTFPTHVKIEAVTPERLSMEVAGKNPTGPIHVILNYRMSGLKWDITPVTYETSQEIPFLRARRRMCTEKFIGNCRKQIPGYKEDFYYCEYTPELQRTRMPLMSPDFVKDSTPTDLLDPYSAALLLTELSHRRY